MLDLTQCKTEDLLKEINSRKKAEIPKLVEKLNSIVTVLDGYGVKIKGNNEDYYFIDKFELDIDGDEIRVDYIEEEF